MSGLTPDLFQILFDLPANSQLLKWTFELDMNNPDKIPYMTACEARWYISYRAGGSLDEVATAGQAIARFIAETTHEAIWFEKVTLRYQCVDDYEEFSDYLANPFEYDASIDEIVTESETGSALTEALTDLKEACTDGFPVLQYLRTGIASTKILLDDKAIWVSKESPEFELYRYDQFQGEQAIEDPLTIELQLRPMSGGGKLTIAAGDSETWTVETVVGYINESATLNAGAYSAAIDVPDPDGDDWITCLAVFGNGGDATVVHHQSRNPRSVSTDQFALSGTERLGEDCCTHPLSVSREI